MNHALKIMIRNVIRIQIIMLTLANAFSSHAMRHVNKYKLCLCGYMYTEIDGILLPCLTQYVLCLKKGAISL